MLILTSEHTWLFGNWQICPIEQFFFVIAAKLHKLRHIENQKKESYGHDAKHGNYVLNMVTVTRWSYFSGGGFTVSFQEILKCQLSI